MLGCFLIVSFKKILTNNLFVSIVCGCVRVKREQPACCGVTRKGDWFTLGDVPGLTAGVTMRVTEYGTAPVLGKVGSAVAWLGRHKVN